MTSSTPGQDSKARAEHRGTWEGGMPYNRMRAFNKNVLNHFTRLLARIPLGPFAVICHAGRKTGKLYETPIMVEQSGDNFVVALTYGADVDWYRNVRAAGRASLVWHGGNYALQKPEPLSAEKAMSLYSPFERMILQRRGTRDFVSMKYQEGKSTLGEKNK